MHLMYTSLRSLDPPDFACFVQLLVEETDELLKVSLAAIRTEIAATPAWSGAPTPTDDFLLMFLRAEVFSPEKAAARYRKFWEVRERALMKQVLLVSIGCIAVRRQS